MAGTNSERRIWLNIVERFYHSASRPRTPGWCWNATPKLLASGFDPQHWWIGFGNPIIEGTKVLYGRGGSNWDLYGIDLGIAAPAAFPILSSNYNESAVGLSGSLAIVRKGQSPNILYGVDMNDIGGGFSAIEGSGSITDSAVVSGNWILYAEGDNIYANQILPEPATLSLLVVGGLAMLRRKRIKT